MSLQLAEDCKHLNVEPLIDYNNSLEKNASLARLNENFFDEKIHELEEIGPIGRELYWLTVARLNELTLFCAGNYADNFEFTAVGDLLVNPRLILVHRKGYMTPVIKQRHMNLTDQFVDAAETEKGIIEWLKKETTLEIKKKPVLPYLYECLEMSGYLSPLYLSSAERRMQKVADTVGFFAGSCFVDSCDYYMRLQNIPEHEKELIKSMLCGFTTRTFDELGVDFYRHINETRFKSRFLL
jgi:hypothetical protein